MDTRYSLTHDGPQVAVEFALESAGGLGRSTSRGYLPMDKHAADLLLQIISQRSASANRDRRISCAHSALTSAVLDRVCTGGHDRHRGRRAVGCHFAESPFAPFAGVALVRRPALARIADE
jgi:hypothetical protein